MNHIKPYFGSSARVWDDISWVLDIEDTGFFGWEICADGNYHFGKPECYKSVIETLESTGLKATVHAPYADLNPAAINDNIWHESVKQLNDCIEKASAFTDKVTIHPGYLSSTGKLVPEKVWSLQKEAVMSFGKTATDCGVLVCIENMPDIHGFFCQYPEEILGLIEGIEGVGMTIDFGHANTLGRVEMFRKVIDKANHLHIHDNHGSRDEHLPIGSGTIDWDTLSNDIIKRYKGIVVVEGRSLKEAKQSIEAIKRW